MNRKAELQRKLGIAPVPKPPDDLAQRIKNDIPRNLGHAAEPDRAVSLRVAASILVLISTAFLAVRFFERSKAGESVAPATVAAKPAVLTSSDTPVMPADTIEPARIAQKARQKKALTEIAALQKHEEEPKAAETAADKVAANVTTPAVTAPAAPAAAAPQVMVDRIAVKSAGAPDDRIVQKFAAPESLPRGVELEAEAVEDPLAPGKVIVRASVDAGVTATVMVDISPRPDAARGEQALAMSPRWGGGTFEQTKTALILLSPRSERVATVRMTYRLEGDYQEHKLEKAIDRGDVRTWTAASRRMKAATLAALWKAGADPAAVAAKAREAGLDELADEIEPDR